MVVCCYEYELRQTITLSDITVCYRNLNLGSPVLCTRQQETCHPVYPEWPLFVRRRHRSGPNCTHTRYLVSCDRCPWIFQAIANVSSDQWPWEGVMKSTPNVYTTLQFVSTRLYPHLLLWDSFRKLMGCLLDICRRKSPLRQTGVSTHFTLAWKDLWFLFLCGMS